MSHLPGDVVDSIEKQRSLLFEVAYPGAVEPPWLHRDTEKFCELVIAQCREKREKTNGYCR